MSDEELKKAGLKVTSPRVKILRLLETTQNRHMSAEDIYKALALHADKDIGLATIYRVLTQFEAAGIVKRHNFEGPHAVYELNQGTHHDHLVCIKCNGVEEFIDEVIEKRQEIIAANVGFKIVDHNLNIYGVCKKCQS